MLKAGHRITIYIEQVKAFGKIFDALRIKPTLPVSKVEPAPKCEKCKTDVKPAGSMDAKGMAAYTKKKYGAVYCADCATAISSEKAKQAEEVKPIEETKIIEETKGNELNENK